MRVQKSDHFRFISTDEQTQVGADIYANASIGFIVFY